MTGWRIVGRHLAFALRVLCALQIRLRGISITVINMMSRRLIQKASSDPQLIVNPKSVGKLIMRAVAQITFESVEIKKVFIEAAANTERQKACDLSLTIRAARRTF